MVDVKALRERHRLSRRAFCDIFEIPYRTVQSWELGLRECPVWVYKMIEFILNHAASVGALERKENNDGNECK
jgi:DNA-binding transcriptional regulator YiaG